MGRKDGVRIKHADPMYAVVPHIMPERSDAMNMIELTIPVEPMNQYIQTKRREGTIISHLALVIGAYVRTIAEFPQLNRFIVNKNIYARKGIQISMVVLKPGTEGEETESKMYFDPEDDILEVNRKLLEFIDKSRSVEAKDKNSTDKIIATLVGVPGLLRFGVSFLKWMDKHGLLPLSIIGASPFHASMTITNLASVRTNDIYHHIYNFGTTSQLMALGNLRETPRRDGYGGIVFDRTIPIGLVMDERICTGSYYARAFKRLQGYLKDPSTMEGPPKDCIREWELKGL